MLHHRNIHVVLGSVIACAFACVGQANPVLTPDYPNFTIVPLGPISGIPAGYSYDAMSFNGAQLLLGGGVGFAANPGYQTIYSVPVTRDSSGEITGFGTATPYANVEVATPAQNGNEVAGGMIFAPNGTLLYTTQFSSFIGQYSPGATTSSLTSVGPIPLGGLGYLPNGQLVLTSTDGSWYPVTLSSPDSHGFYTITVGSSMTGVNADADAFANLPGGIDSNILSASVLVGDTGRQALTIYTLGAGGLPTLNGSCPDQNTPCEVVFDNSNVIGAGVVEDPIHPVSYLFTSSNGSIYELTADAPEPSGVLLAFGGLALFWAGRRRFYR